MENWLEERGKSVRGFFLFFFLFFSSLRNKFLKWKVVESWIIFSLRGG